MAIVSLRALNSISILDEELLSALQSEFAGRAAHFDTTAEFPHENFRRLGELGYLALVVPKEFGGSGGKLAEATRLIGSVAGGDASTALLLAMHSLMHASLSQRVPKAYEKVAQAAVAGGGLLNALRAEPELGSVNRGGSLGTIAAAQPDGSWRINGKKAYATGSPIVSWWLVFARTDEATPRMGSWLVPGKAPGVTYQPTWNHMGLRATASHQADLVNVDLHADDVLSLLTPAEASAGNPILNAWNAVLIAALYDGIAKAARDWVRQFLFDRKPSNLGAALATVPRLQSVIGEIEGLLLVNRSLIEAAALKSDAGGGDLSAQPLLVKQIVTDNAVKVVDLALSISGNHGLDKANPLERHHRDVLCGRVHAPQGDSVFLAAGKESLRV